VTSARLKDMGDAVGPHRRHAIRSTTRWRCWPAEGRQTWGATLYGPPNAGHRSGFDGINPVETLQEGRRWTGPGFGRRTGR